MKREALSAATAAVGPGESTTVTATTALVNGEAEPITFSAGTAPSGGNEPLRARIAIRVIQAGVPTPLFSDSFDWVAGNGLAFHARLANAIATLKTQGSEPFLQPYLFDNAGWVERVQNGAYREWVTANYGQRGA